jgi:hypothetical protein
MISWLLGGLLAGFGIHYTRKKRTGNDAIVERWRSKVANNGAGALNHLTHSHGGRGG